MRMELAMQVLRDVNTFHKDVGRLPTYNKPKEKAIDKPIFFDKTMLSCKMMGTGMRKMMKSLVTCQAACEYQNATLLMQNPC